MRLSLGRLLETPTGGTKFRYKFGYVIRLATLAAVLAVLIAIIKIDIIGLVIGLSVVIINLFWMTVQRTL
jgi:hypothetical protein